MSQDPIERLVEALLAGMPAHALDALTAEHPALRAALDDARETLAAVGLSLAPVAPSPALRARVAETIAAHEHRTARRALLVADMLVDHLTPGRPLEVPRARSIVPAVRARIDAAHAEGVPVVYLCDRHAPDDPELALWGDHNVEGTEGCEVIPELRPQEGDTVVTHRTYSAFHDSDLDATLKSLGVNTLVLTGCTTDVILLFTAGDAMMRGYQVEVPTDCHAGSSEAAERMALNTLAFMRPLEPRAA